MTARLRWHYSPMNGGKSTLALQLDYNHRQCCRQGIRFTCLDRAGQAIITSRLGISADAHEVTPTTNLAAVVRDAVTAGENITYVIADEAQF